MQSQYSPLTEDFWKSSLPGFFFLGIEKNRTQPQGNDLGFNQIQIHYLVI